jgi:hypothetical protein
MLTPLLAPVSVMAYEVMTPDQTVSIPGWLGGNGKQIPPDLAAFHSARVLYCNRSHLADGVRETLNETQSSAENSLMACSESASTS